MLHNNNSYLNINNNFEARRFEDEEEANTWLNWYNYRLSLRDLVGPQLWNIIPTYLPTLNTWA